MDNSPYATNKQAIPSGREAYKIGNNYGGTFDIPSGSCEWNEILEQMQSED